jgi:hypothetical protein
VLWGMEKGGWDGGFPLNSAFSVSAELETEGEPLAPMRISVVSSHHSFHYRRTPEHETRHQLKHKLPSSGWTIDAIHVEATVNAVTGSIMAVCTHGGPKLSARKAPWASPTMIGQLHPS